MASKSAAAVVDLAPSQTAAKQGAWFALSYYSIGHFFIDLYSNALGVFAPMLVEHLGISLTQAGFLGA